MVPQGKGTPKNGQVQTRTPRKKAGNCLREELFHLFRTPSFFQLTKMGCRQGEQLKSQLSGFSPGVKGKTG